MIDITYSCVKDGLFDAIEKALATEMTELKSQAVPDLHFQYRQISYTINSNDDGVIIKVDAIPNSDVMCLIMETLGIGQVTVDIVGTVCQASLDIKPPAQPAGFFSRHKKKIMFGAGTIATAGACYYLAKRMGVDPHTLKATTVDLVDTTSE